MLRREVIAGLIAVALAGCGGKRGGEGGGCPEFDPWPTGGDGADVSVPPPEGEARAGRIADESGVPPGVKLGVEVGDFMMRNRHVVFVIEDGGGSDGYNPFGGEIAHADLVDEAGEPAGRNLFGESYHGLAMRLLDPGSVSVVADGTGGGEAVVRVVGEVRNMPLLDVAFGFLFTVNDGVVYSADYVLGPDSEFLEVRFNVRNPLPQWAYPNLLISGTVQGDGLAPWTPEAGFDGEGLGGSHALFGHVGRQLSYAWMNPEGGDLDYVMAASGMLIMDRGDTVAAEGCTEQTVGIVRLLVASGGAEELLRAERRVLGEPEPPATIFALAVEGGGDPAGARVHVTDDSGAYVTSVLADDSGAWTAGLPSGSYLATALLDGHPAVRDVPFTSGPSGGTVDITIPEAATVTYTVVDDAGDPVPAKLVFFALDPPDPLPPSFGEPTWPGGAAAYVFEATGSGSLLLAPGDYEVTASRGFEYEIDEQTLTAAAGVETPVAFTLDHSVDSTGMLCGDFHVHSFPSADSDDPRLEKLHAALAEGVEILASTDHEQVADYGPDVAAAGLGSAIMGMSGEELTTFDYGHFNVLDQTVSPDEPNDGAIVWYYRDAPELFAEIRTDPLDPVIQLNHPRSESFEGYFTSLGFDPETGTVAHPELWSPDFDAFEVFNSNPLALEMDSALDWFALLDMGLRVTATGNSDTHDYVEDEIGYARTCLIVGHDDPSALAPSDVTDAIRAMRALDSGGILVTVEGPGGELPGDILDAPSGSADVHVVVQAPLWVAADRLRVFVDGVETDTITLDASTADPANPVVRYDDTVPVETDGDDGWVVFAAEGDTEMDPVVMRRLPFGMTNPLYLDADSDGSIAPRLPLP